MEECNRRLYHYYRTLAPELPDSFREMEPLFLAVICGCNAGLFREALHTKFTFRGILWALGPQAAGVRNRVTISKSRPKLSIVVVDLKNTLNRAPSHSYPLSNRSDIVIEHQTLRGSRYCESLADRRCAIKLADVLGFWKLGA